MPTRIYNRVAQLYDRDWSGIYAAARARCMAQISQHNEATVRPLDTVDLGVGTGNSLHELERILPLGKRTGFDLSAQMLEQARAKLGQDVQLVCADALSADAYLRPGSSDLVLCHFLLSFVDTRSLLRVAHRLLRPGGMLSLATTTRGSLKELHSGRFRRSGKLLGVRSALRRARIPVDHAQCIETLRAQGFEICAQQLYRQAVRFESFDDVRGWALDSGWAAGELDDRSGLRIAGFSAIFALARLVMHPLYPIDATKEISIVLAQKPAGDDLGKRHPTRVSAPAHRPSQATPANTGGVR